MAASHPRRSPAAQTSGLERGRCATQQPAGFAPRPITQRAPLAICKWVASQFLSSAARIVEVVPGEGRAPTRQRPDHRAAVEIVALTCCSVK